MAIQSLLIIVGVLAVLLVLGVPISYSIGISSLVAILQTVPLDVSVVTGAQRIFDKLKGLKGRKVIFINWAGAGNPFKIADLDPKRYGIEIATGGNILPALAAYKAFPNMEGSAYYYYEIPKNAVNKWLVAEHQKRFNAPPDFFTAGGMSAGIAVVEALRKTQGDASTEKLIAAMEGMVFETPKGKMMFRKEDHQALQSMYHFKIKVDPNVAWAIPTLVREIKMSEMAIPGHGVAADAKPPQEPKDPETAKKPAAKKSK